MGQQSEPVLPTEPMDYVEPAQADGYWSARESRESTHEPGPKYERTAAVSCGVSRYFHDCMNKQCMHGQANVQASFRRFLMSRLCCSAIFIPQVLRSRLR